jgi:hypothetical protein
MDYQIIPNLTYLGNQVYYRVEQLPLATAEITSLSTVIAYQIIPNLTYLGREVYTQVEELPLATASVTSSVPTASVIAPSNLNSSNSNVTSSVIPVSEGSHFKKIVTEIDSVKINFESVCRWLNSNKNKDLYKPKYGVRNSRPSLVGFILLGKYVKANPWSQKIQFTNGIFNTNTIMGVDYNLYYDPTSSGGNRRKSYRRGRVSAKRKSRK